MSAGKLIPTVREFQSHFVSGIADLNHDVHRQSEAAAALFRPKRVAKANARSDATHQYERITTLNETNALGLTRLARSGRWLADPS